MIVGLVVLLAAPLARAAAKDEDVLRKMQDDFAAAWAKDDAKALAGFFADDGDLVNPVGRMAKGRAEIEKLFSDEHSGPLKGTKIAASGCTVRLVKTDVGITSCNFEVTGGNGPDGKPMALKGMYTLVSVKKDGKWWITAGRAMTPPPAPPAAPK